MKTVIGLLVLGGFFLFGNGLLLSADPALTETPDPQLSEKAERRVKRERGKDKERKEPRRKRREFEKGGKQRREKVEMTGTIEVRPPEGKKKFSTVLLKAGDQTLRLLPKKRNIEAFKPLETMVGQTVTIKGRLLPASQRHPMAAIRVHTWTSGAHPAAPVTTPVAAPK